MPARLALLDPARRFAPDLDPVATAAGVALVVLDGVSELAGLDVAGVLVPAAIAADLPPATPGGPARWVIGDSNAAGRMAGAAAACGAAGVVLTPIGAPALRQLTLADGETPAEAAARGRSLIAASVVEAATQATLTALAAAFSADDCIVWWRDGETMEPQGARANPDDGYRQTVGAAARIAAAAAGTVLLAGPDGRSLIAEPLRTGPSEIAGLVAVVADQARRFSSAERADLRALATRLARELSWIAGYRRLVAEGERLAASSLHDPLTHALTRSAFEQAVTSEIAAAGRRGERLAMALIDVVGLRKINLQHGHDAGDEVMAHVAAAVRAGVRTSDPIGRFGGDELAVLFGNATVEQAAAIVTKLIDKVSAAPLETGSERVELALRGAVTPIAPGARSGEAAFARLAAAVRRGAPGVVQSLSTVSPASDGESLGESASLSAGTIVGGTYRVRHELSRGAMGVVYRGEDLGLGRAVAIKVLRSDLASDRELVSKFRAEAATLAAIHHENLVQVYSLGEHLGDVYFVMELVEGQSLADVLRSQNERAEWFPIAAIAQIAMEIADALDAMHAAGVIHRDVKPANILLDRERDRAVLVDVGVAAKSGVRREAAGTPGFAAPESFLDSEDTRETDVYGLAATVYCMLTGAPPFVGANLLQAVSKQLHDPLVPPSSVRPTLPEAVDAVLAKALDPAPRKRWSSASAFAVALARALERVGPEPERVRMDTETPAAVRAAQAVLAPTEALGRAEVESPRGGRGVRAAHFRVAGRVVGHRLGDATLRTLVAEHPGLAGLLSPNVAPLEWFELPQLIELLEALHAAAPAEDLARHIGRSTVNATLTRFLGANPSSLTVETVLRAMPTFWTRYHEWSQVTITQLDELTGSLVVRGDAGSPRVCELVAGELERVVELAGGAAPVVVHTTCTARGDAQCTFDVDWTAPARLEPTTLQGPTMSRGARPEPT